MIERNTMIYKVKSIELNQRLKKTVSRITRYKDVPEREERIRQDIADVLQPVLNLVEKDFNR
jgi:hypothetical protein